MKGEEQEHKNQENPYDVRTKDEDRFFFSEKEENYDINISSNYEVISVNWIDTPNWTIHPFFSEVVKKATLSGSEKGFHIINIERRIWDREISKLLARMLEVFEEKMRRKGKNTRNELNEFLSKQLEGLL